MGSEFQVHAFEVYVFFMLAKIRRLDVRTIKAFEQSENWVSQSTCT